MYIYEFYRLHFVPVCLSRCQKSTRQIYDQVIRLWVDEIGDSELSEISPADCELFVTASLKRVGPFTVAKYCRCLNAIFLRMSKPGWRNRKAFGFIDDAPYCEPPKLQKALPKQILDRDILKLIESLSDIKEFPKSVDEKLRPLWWRSLVLFASTTAVRRTVIFGLTWEAVDVSNKFFFISPELDKVGHARIKYLHPNLSRLLLKIRTEDSRLFAWDHGFVAFYREWGKACENAGIKLTLHDLKRYASQVAIRSGADIATLKEFCDHSNINTTLQHYARGDVESLIEKLQLPSEVWND